MILSKSMQTFLSAWVLMWTSVMCVQANGLRNPPEGAAATGLGLGKMAQIDDPSAVVHNPANLAGAKKSEVMVSATFANFNVDFKSPDGRSGSSKESINVLPSVFAVHPLNEEFTLGLGLFVPFGQAAEWDKDGPFRGVAPYYAELYTLDLNPTLSYVVNEKLSVAAGISLIMSSIETKQQLVSPVDPSAPALDAQAEGDDTSFGWNLAATLRPAEGHALALTYRSGFEVDYDGDTSISPTPPPFSANSDFKTQIEFPQIVGFGYAIELDERWHVGVDAEWTESSSYDTLPLDFGANSAFLPLPPEISQAWKDSWSYGIGVAYALDAAWTLRGGYDFFESPVPQETLSPTLPDSDRHAFSLGLGYLVERHRFDISYALSLHDVDVSANQNPAYIGSYDMERHLLAVSYGLEL